MKYAIVTGGTKGIGRGVTKMLLNKGYYVIATYAHDATAARVLQEEVAEQLSRLELIQVDQSVRSATYAFIEHIKASIPQIHCVVCNAGVTCRSPFINGTDEQWDTMMEVAVHSHYILLRELFSLIAPHSRILFTGSEMALHPHGTVLGYGVSKSAVHALAQNLVKEFEATATTVNVVAPGFVDTEWQQNKPQEIRENICRKTAIHRFASVDEVVSAYAFCIDNGFVNGAVLKVDGGYCYR